MNDHPPSTKMSFHPYHLVSFYQKSSLFRPSRPVKVNCTTFHHYLQLSPADQDLHWALGLCFVCGKKQHRSECCRWIKAHGPLFCSLLPDPYRQSFLSCCHLVLISAFTELDCVRPEHAGSGSPHWDNADSGSPHWDNAQLAYPPTPPSSGSFASLPSLVPVSETSTGSSIWGSNSLGLSQFDRDVDGALEVEDVMGRGLSGFPEVVVSVPVLGEEEVEEFDIRTQVAYRSAGPPWSSSASAGSSGSSAIYVE